MITIPGHLDGLNEYTRANRASIYTGAAMKRNNEKKVKEAIAEALENAEARPVNADDYPLCVFITWHDDTRRDLDNIVFAKKFIFDALSAAGIIKDDSMKYIVAVHERVERNKENPHIDVEFEKIV